MMKARIALLTDVREKVLSAEQRAKLPPITEPPVAAPKAPAADSKAPAADSKVPAK